MTKTIWPNNLRALRLAKPHADGRRRRAEDVAADLDISQPYVSMLESGKRRPDLRLLERLAQYYGVPIPALEMGTQDRAPDRDEIVGAWIRIERRRLGLSIEKLAMLLPSKPSPSVVRDIETGLREVWEGDEVSRQLAAALGQSSVREMRHAATQAFDHGELADDLRYMHPERPWDSRDVAIGRYNVPVPAFVMERMRPGEEVVFLADKNWSDPLPWAAYAIVRPGWIPDWGVVERGGDLLEMKDGAPFLRRKKVARDGTERGVVALIPLVNKAT